MLDRKEIDIEIARLEYGESSYPAYAKLADLYTIRNQMDCQEKPSYKNLYSAAPAKEMVSEPKVYGNSDFLRAVSEKSSAETWAIMDDLMDTLHVVNPRVYDGVMRKINIDFIFFICIKMIHVGYLFQSHHKRVEDFSSPPAPLLNNFKAAS